MRLTVGIKIGGGFFLVTLMLIIAGAVGFSGALNLGNSIDYVAAKAWPTAEGSATLAIAIQHQTALVKEITSGLEPISNTVEKDLTQSKTNASAGLASITDSGLVSADDLQQLQKFYADYQARQGELLNAHGAFVKARDSAFKGFEEFDTYMNLLSFYASQVYNLSNVDDSDKWEIMTDFYRSKVALQMRFYFMQRLLGGDDRAKMLDSLERAGDDLDDQSSAMADLDLMNNPIRTGAFEGKKYNELLLALVKSHKEQFKQLTQALDAFNNAKTSYAASESKLLDDSHKLKQTIEELVSGETANATATKRSVYTTIILSLIVGVVIAVLATLFCIVTVVRPIIRVGQRMKDIAVGEGDLTATLPVNGNDEIAYQAQHFNAFVAKIRHTITQIIAANRELSAAAQALAEVSSKTNLAAEKQQAGSAQIATALYQMSTSIQDVAKNATHAEKATETANEQVSQSQLAVNQNKDAIGELAADVEKASEVIVNLEQESGAVGNILSVIQGIAEQTNLLALNAAIEAARAGEQGRGFAVVADEVRTLAQRTQQSTREIGVVIENLQSKSKNAVAVMSGSRSRAETSVDNANRVNEMLQSVGASVDEVFNMNSQIATAVEQQAAVADEINQNVTAISHLSEQTAIDAHATMDTSRRVTGLVEQLQQLTQQFKV